MDRDEAIRRAGGPAPRWELLLACLAALRTFVGPRVREEDVERIVQEVLLRGYRSPGPVRKGKALRAWLCGIARKRLLELRRERRPPPERVRDAILEGDTSRVPPTPFEALVRSETRARVRTAFASLPPRHQVTLDARYLREQTLAEMAERAGTTVKAIERRIDRARRAFREAFGEDGFLE